MRPIAAAFDAPLPSLPLVCCRKQEAPAGRCWQDVLLLFLPSAAATGCCCDVACFLFRSYSPPSALLLAFACFSFALLRLLPCWGSLSSLSCGIKKAKQGNNSQQNNYAFALDRPCRRRGVRTEKDGPVLRRALARNQIGAAGIGDNSRAARPSVNCGLYEAILLEEFELGRASRHLQSQSVASSGRRSSFTSDGRARGREPKGSRGRHRGHS